MDAKIWDAGLVRLKLQQGDYLNIRDCGSTYDVLFDETGAMCSIGKTGKWVVFSLTMAIDDELHAKLAKAAEVEELRVLKERLAEIENEIAEKENTNH